MKLLFFICLLVIFSVVKAEWTLSLRLISYYKQYNIALVQGTRLEYCCCNCNGVGSNCCDPDATTINQNCINGCGIHLSVCGRQGSGPSTCSNTTSSILVGHNATFEENANYGGLQNPIQVMLGNLSSESITLDVFVMNENEVRRRTSLGSFSVSIPPQSTTSYSNRMTSNTHNDAFLSASFTYDYRLTCSPQSACPTSGPNGTSRPPNGTSSILVKSSIWLLILITLLISAAAVQ